ncbi:putative transferase, protein kinase STE-STE11 family [Rosa chinensis]|uniref:Putative transferase, protein kinase STE-STE11 family n=1 Tax=Rosa chinensis TaxID=74649 RepID=A0A2P6RMW5_ROSCH|nr:putative transferase, protein kinase STE-STE11 family [Rosa chinensis]
MKCFDLFDILFGRLINTKRLFLFREARIWSLLDHRNVVKYHGCWVETAFWGGHEGGFIAEEKKPCLYLKLEACDSSLAAQTINDLKKICDIVQAVLKGLVYLHSKGIVHGDIRAANILISDGKAKICDFGRASHGTDLDQKQDIKKFGLLIVEMLDPSALPDARLRSRFPKEFKALAEQLEEMTAPNPETRPTSAELLRHKKKLIKAIMGIELR